MRQVVPKIGFDRKDTGFERFTFIPDDPENLSKFHNASMKLSLII